MVSRQLLFILVSDKVRFMNLPWQPKGKELVALLEEAVVVDWELVRAELVELA